MSQPTKVVITIASLLFMQTIFCQVKLGIRQYNTFTLSDQQNFASNLGLNIDAHLNLRYSFQTTFGYQLNTIYYDEYYENINNSDLRIYNEAALRYAYLSLGFKTKLGEDIGLILRYDNQFKVQEDLKYQLYSFVEEGGLVTEAKEKGTDYFPKYNSSASLNLYVGRKFKFLCGLGVNNLMSFDSENLPNETINRLYSQTYITVNAGLQFNFYSLKVLKEK